MLQQIFHIILWHQDCAVMEVLLIFVLNREQLSQKTIIDKIHRKKYTISKHKI